MPRMSNPGRIEMIAKLFILFLALAFTLTFADQHHKKRRRVRGKKYYKKASEESGPTLSFSVSSASESASIHGSSSTSSTFTTLQSASSISVLPELGSGPLRSLSDLSANPPELILDLLKDNFDEWFAQASTEECIAVLKNQQNFDLYGSRMMIAALSGSRDDLITELLKQFVLPLRGNSSTMKFEMFKAALNAKLQNPEVAFFDISSPDFIDSVVEILKSPVDGSNYASRLKSLILVNATALKAWIKAAIHSRSYPAMFIVMKALTIPYAKKLAYYVLKHSDSLVPTPEDFRQFLCCTQESIGLSSVLVAAFEARDLDFFVALLRGRLANIFQYRDVRKLLELLSLNRFDQMTLIRGLEILYRLPLRKEIGERVLTIDFDKSLIREAILDDNLFLLRAILGGRFQCEKCMISGVESCQKVSHFLTEEEVLRAYDFAIEQEASQCMKVFFSGGYEWTSKIRGHRFMAYAFKMNKFNFAMKMMEENRIEINLSDTPEINPSGDLLMYAVEHPETFKRLVEKGAYLNVKVSAWSQKVSLLCYLLRLGKCELAKLLFEKGARYTPEDVTNFAQLGGNVECIDLVAAVLSKNKQSSESK